VTQPRASASPAPLVYADVPARQVKMLSSLPVIASFCQRLDISGVIDDLVPIRNVAAVTAGQAVEAMICNRLTSPAPLLHVQDWAGTWAVPEILGIAPASLNDDKLGRTLDAIAPHLEEITGAVAVRAIGTFGIDITQVHWDMTSFSLHGAYEQADEDYPAPSWGHPKDRREDLLQIQAGIAASVDGGIPLYARSYSGGAAEISQVIGAMTSLKKIAGTKKFRLVGDSKLISYDNVAAIRGARCTFLAPASRSYVSPAGLAACDLARATEVDYVAGRDQHKKTSNPGQLGRWYVLEDDQPFWIRNSKRKSDPPIRLRRIFVHSTARAGAPLTSRAKKLTRAREDLDRLVSGLGRRFYPDEQKVTDRIKQISLARKVGPYLRYSVGTAPPTAPPAAPAR
jgi:transposase